MGSLWLKRTLYYVLALLTYGISTRSCIPLGDSNASSSYNGGSNMNLDGCDFTTSSTEAPLMKRNLLNAPPSFGNHSWNNSIPNGIRRNWPIDIKTSEFSLLQKLFRGIVDRFTEAPNRTGITNITKSADLGDATIFMSGYDKNIGEASTEIPPPLLEKLKTYVPSFLPELLGSLTESLDRDLSENEAEESKPTTESKGFLESFRQTLLGQVQGISAVNETEEQTTVSPSELKNELNALLDKVQKQLQKPTVTKDKVDELCEVFKNHVNARTQHFGDRNVTMSNNKVVKTLKKTVDVVCTGSNKKLLKKIVNSRKTWANKITEKVLTRAIDKISKGKSVLRFILNLIMGTIVETEQ